MNNSTLIKNDQYQCITEIDGINDYIRRQSQNGLSHKQILADLTSKNIIHHDRPLMVQDINNRLAPKHMRSVNFLRYQHELINCFKEAYELAGHPRALNEKSAKRFSVIDAQQIRAAAERGTLPEMLNTGTTSLSRLFHYHRQRAFFAACKAYAREKFLSELTSEAIDPTEATQGELWGYGSAEMANENRQLITEMQTEVALLQKEMASLRQALTLMAEALS